MSLAAFELALLFTATAFVFSAMGFAHPEPAVQYHEYSFPNLVVEVLGHFVFGFAGSILLLDLGMSLLVGALAVLIDVDHLLASVGFAVGGRPDHSIAFAVVAGAVLYVSAKRLRVRSDATKMAFAGFIVVLSHVSYDVFSSLYVEPGIGEGFPVLTPFSFQYYYLPGYSWVLLEVLAVLVGLSATLAVRHRLSSPPAGSAPSSDFPEPKPAPSGSGPVSMTEGFSVGSSR